VGRFLIGLYATHAGIRTSHRSTVPYETTSLLWERSPTTRLRASAASVHGLSPGTLSAPRHSTSELLRTL
jgi:hypothetical protein